MRKPTGRIVAFDTEYTAWEGSWQRQWTGPGEYREVVQIGAVALDADDGFRELGAFSVLVRPRINPVLSDYFIGLTGIDNGRLASAGLDFGTALGMFLAFAGDRPASWYSFGDDTGVLRENCRLSGLTDPIPTEVGVNCRDMVTRLAGIDQDTASGSLHRHLGFSVEGDAHDALFDARGVAGALRVLRRRGLL
ncbi:MAG: exonuclease domain-containing protein [Alphaproteobacteria bacterium]|nr:exonuclease domain-containing protein [Alphaproteobacteria bacterium]